MDDQHTYAYGEARELRAAVDLALFVYSRKGTPSAQFEAVVDAIFTADIETLKTLLRANPDLVRTRWTSTAPPRSIMFRRTAWKTSARRRRRA